MSSLPVRALTLAMILAIVITGCGKKKTRVAVPAGGNGTAAAAPPIGTTERGVASWYGHPYHGRPAADGEIYDMETLVAAHRTMPFNTWLKVTNVENDKAVTVCVI